MMTDLPALSETLQQHDCEVLRQLRQTNYAIEYAGRMLRDNVSITVREYFPQAIARRTAELSVQPRQQNFQYEFVAGRSEFVNAARNLVELRHTNLERVFSAFEENNTAYIVSSHQQASSFVDYCRGGVSISEDDLMDVLRHLLSGLEQFHNLGIIHGDINPANILLLPNKSPVLIDFAMTRRFESKASSHTRISNYMAPEHLTGARQGPWTDIYALGATLYHVITETVPPEYAERLQSLRDRSSETIESVMRKGEGRYSELFLRTIDAAMAMDPKDRLPSARTWLEWLETISEPQQQLHANVKPEGTIELVLDWDYGEFRASQSEELVREVRKLLGNNEKITVKSVEPGSVRVTLAMLPSLAEQLFWAVKRGEFRALNVQDACLIGAAAAQALLEGKRASRSYDVFLCHNHVDKLEVKRIGSQLESYGILPWLDEWDLRPGVPWQRELEAIIPCTKSAAVFVGSAGTGPWQELEIEAYLREFVDRACPVVPVILSCCDAAPPLPTFLKGMTFVDFRKEQPDPLERLVWGITGERSPQEYREGYG